MLLALVATGTFAVLLSTSRKSAQPDIREEMALAVDRASQMLQVYTLTADQQRQLDDDQIWGGPYANGLCGNDETPVATGDHFINCLLPPMCDLGESYFKYTVASSGDNMERYLEGDDLAEQGLKDSQSITFDIQCKGFTL